MADRGLVIAAMPMSAFVGGRYRVPGSVVEYCAACKTPVSLSPSSQKILAETPGARARCVDCAMAAMREDGDAEVTPPTPAQVTEIEAWRRSREKGGK